MVGPLAGRSGKGEKLEPVEEQAIDVEALKGGLGGTAVAPGEQDWDEGRSAWNLAVDQHPAAVAYVKSAEDVSAVIAFARANGLRVISQGTGHGVACGGPLDGMILVKTERMNGIEIDAERGVGRFEAGVIWRDACNAAGDHGLATLSGSSPDVGIVGYTTGGGFGWLARRHGLACNSVRAIELVTADGELRRVDADADPDLFWALRGGGGSFGVVTAIEFGLIDLPEVFAGSVVYPADEGSGEILHRYRGWTRDIPDEVTSIARFLHLPPLPQIPEPLRDRPLITIGACYAGPESEGAEVVAPLRELGDPVMDLFGAMSPSQLVTVHMEPEEPVPGLVNTASLGDLPEEAVDAFVEAAGPESGSPLLLAELRHAGGAAGRPADGAGALSHIDAEFVMLGVGLAMSPELGEAITRHLSEMCGALGPWSTNGCYFNFADRPAELDELFASDTLARLRGVKRRYDPDDVIGANHAIAIA
jgi:FAD binding domain/Berberine and berberine like